MSNFDKYIDALVGNERPDDTYPKNESSWEELFEFGRRRIFEIVVLKRELAELRAENEKLKTDFVQMTHNCVGVEMEADALRAVVEAAREAEQAINKAGITMSGDAWNKLSKLAAALARVEDK